MARLTDKRAAFLAHRSRAEWRGIPFRLTFGEWSALWAPHWAGREQRRLVMARTGDQGAYELGNVRIATCAENNKEAAIRRRGSFQAPRKPVLPNSLPERVARLERKALRLALQRTEDNKTQAAKRLGLTFRQFRYLATKYGL